jgi:ethanolamine ammonia-lyase small subunit
MTNKPKPWVPHVPPLGRGFPSEPQPPTPANQSSTLANVLRTYTPARVGLGRTGPSVPTTEQLRFQLDHALARDAVHAHLNVPALLRALQQRKLAALAVQSAVTVDPQQDARQLYLRRPDLGRTLHPQSVQALQQLSANSNEKPEIVFIIADGLSALAIERHALPLLDATIDLLNPDQSRIGPICIVTQARVAIGDEIGQLLHAQLAVTLIGERPGLSAPDSLGVYITWQPRPGRTDAERNCISNIRNEGLSYAEAAQRILFYINGAKQLQCTGIRLKENTALSGQK